MASAPRSSSWRQVASARAITSAATRPGTGEVLFPGHLMPGTELEWDVLGGPRPLRFSQSAIANLVYRNREWNDRNTVVVPDHDLVRPRGRVQIFPAVEHQITRRM